MQSISGHHVQAHCQAERRDGVVTVGGGEVVQQQGGENQVEALNELGGTDRDHGLDDGGVEGEVADVCGEVLALTHQEQQVVQHGCAVRQQHRPTGTGDAHAHDGDEQHVEDAGDDGADDDAVHGLLGVAFGSDELFEGEHADSEGRAEEHEVHVDAGRFVGAAGCTHDAGDRVGEDEADSRRRRYRHRAPSRGRRR